MDSKGGETSAIPPKDSISGPDVGQTPQQRRRLLSITYRLLGSMSEAEDAVQETYARWFSMTDQQRSAVESPDAWLTTVATRVCLDVLKSGRKRREVYVGEWLPEPLPHVPSWLRNHSDVERSGDPADQVALSESLTMAFLVLLESMSPAQRVVLILHDVFGYSFRDIARMVGRSPAACRKLASSGRQRARSAETLDQNAIAQRDRIVAEFKSAWQAKDVTAIVSLLDPNAEITADSGGRAEAAHVPIAGAHQVAHHLIKIAESMPSSSAFSEADVNGERGLVLRQDDRVVAVLTFGITAGGITRIWAMRNPDKLLWWNAP